MIVVDTNIIASFYLPTDQTVHAEKLLAATPNWIAPILWRSEFRNVLALYMRKKMLTFDEAYAIQIEAESQFRDNEYELASHDVLTLVNTSECSAYDCEFVALAKQLNIQRVTNDNQLLKRFPDVAVSLREAVQ